MLIPYVVAIFAMLLAASSFLTLMYAVDHFDPPESRSSHERSTDKVAV
jgi:hypothetical protein